jgi:hypothetical protein
MTETAALDWLIRTALSGTLPGKRSADSEPFDSVPTTFFSLLAIEMCHSERSAQTSHRERRYAIDQSGILKTPIPIGTG